MTDENPEEERLPETVTIDEAFRAAYDLAQACIALERDPDDGLVLFLQYLDSDPARWDNWKAAMRTSQPGRAGRSVCQKAPAHGRNPRAATSAGSGGVDLSIIDVSSKASFSNDTELKWHFGGTHHMCGSTNYGWVSSPETEANA